MVAGPSQACQHTDAHIHVHTWKGKEGSEGRRKTEKRKEGRREGGERGREGKREGGRKDRTPGRCMLPWGGNPFIPFSEPNWKAQKPSLKRKRSAQEDLKQS